MSNNDVSSGATSEKKPRAKLSLGKKINVDVLSKVDNMERALARQKAMQQASSSSKPKGDLTLEEHAARMQSLSSADLAASHSSIIEDTQKQKDLLRERMASNTALDAASADEDEIEEINEAESSTDEDEAGDGAGEATKEVEKAAAKPSTSDSSVSTPKADSAARHGVVKKAPPHGSGHNAGNASSTESNADKKDKKAKPYGENKGEDKSKSNLKNNKIEKYGIENFLVSANKDGSEDEIDVEEYIMLYGGSIKIKASHSTYHAEAPKKKVRTSSSFVKQRVAPVKFKVHIGDEIEVEELAHAMSVKVGKLIKALAKSGITATKGDVIDGDSAQLVAEEMGRNVERVSNDVAKQISAIFDYKDDESCAPRNPVVTIMGHVDHGKTSLLDVIRNANVADGESGGITQKIGAYTVSTPKGEITFIDTPGHSAFEEMRSRGANVTDIVVLVVAADDGIMPQTVEAIKHAKNAGVGIIVAINKIDRPAADIESVKSNLMSHDLVPEEYGGNIMIVPVSAKENLNIDKLLDAILLQAEIMELKANSKGLGRAVVVESYLDKSRGPVATVLVKSGVIKKGDIVVAGDSFGKVRLMFDDKGKPVNVAGPSTPIELLGMKKPATAGERLAVVPSEREAVNITQYFIDQNVNNKNADQEVDMTDIDAIFANAAEKQKVVDELKVVIKADLDGSMEAITNMLNAITHPELSLTIVHSGVGNVSESDINIAQTSGAHVLCFNTSIDSKTRKVAEASKVKVHSYNIIYELEKDVKEMLSAMLKPILHEESIGTAEVRVVFNLSRNGVIAGCQVLSGEISRNAKIKVIRAGKVIAKSDVCSLQTDREEMKVVKAGHECGIKMSHFNDIKEKDILETYKIREEKRFI